jgi:hypothetical protein
MRNMMNGSRLSMVMAVALAVTAMTAATPALAAIEPLAVKNVSISGGIVQVTVKNFSLAPAVASVTVEAVVGGLSSFSIVPVVLLPGQSTVVSAAFTGAVTSVKSVGVRCDMNDGDTPI